MKLYTDLREQVKDPTEWRNAGSVVIVFDGVDTDLWVSEDDYTFDETGLSSEEFWAVDEYAKKVQAHLAGETAEHEEYNRYLDEVYRTKY